LVGLSEAASSTMRRSGASHPRFCGRDTCLFISTGIDATDAMLTMFPGVKMSGQIALEIGGM